MRIPSNKTLLKISVYGGVGAISAVMWMRYKIEERIKNTDYFRLAFKELRHNQGAVNLLGEPIKQGAVDLTNVANFCDGSTAKFEVNVKGSKDKGTLFFWATRSTEEGWILKQLELELKGQPEKRFILKRPDEEIKLQHE